MRKNNVFTQASLVRHLFSLLVILLKILLYCFPTALSNLSQMSVTVCMQGHACIQHTKPIKRFPFHVFCKCPNKQEWRSAGNIGNGKHNIFLHCLYHITNVIFTHESRPSTNRSRLISCTFDSLSQTDIHPAQCCLCIWCLNVNHL